MPQDKQRTLPYALSTSAWGLYSLAFLFLLAALSLVVGSRDLSVGTDTANYAQYFENVCNYSDMQLFDPLFGYLTLLIARTEVAVWCYFSILFLLFNFLYFSFFSSIAKWSHFEKRHLLYILLLGFSLASSWYIAATTNGLRQGLSLPLLYFSLFFFFRKKWIKAVFFAFCAAGFHLSSVFVLPFFVTIFLPKKLFNWLVIFAILGYPLGINEALVAFFSRIIGFTVYEQIAMYGVESENWVGFQWDLFLYSIFWVVIYAYLQKFVKKKYIKEFSFFWQLYCILLFPYLFFGFGGYSNRWAVIAWLFLPIIHTAFFYCSRFGDIKYFAISFVVLFGFIRYFIFIYA